MIRQWRSSEQRTSDTVNMGQSQNNNNNKPEVSAYDPKALAFTASNYELHPDGKFKAMATELKMREKSYGDKAPKKEVGLVFTTDHEQEDGENGQVIKWGSPVVSAKSFYGKYLIAIGEDIEEVQGIIADGKFDARNYLRRPCTLIIVHEDRQDGDGQFAKIASVGPPEKKKKGTAAATATTEAQPTPEPPVEAPKPTTERPNFDDDDDD